MSDTSTTTATNTSAMTNLGAIPYEDLRVGDVVRWDDASWWLNYLLPGFTITAVNDFDGGLDASGPNGLGCNGGSFDHERYEEARAADHRYTNFCVMRAAENTTTVEPMPPSLGASGDVAYPDNVMPGTIVSYYNTQYELLSEVPGSSSWRCRWVEGQGDRYSGDHRDHLGNEIWLDDREVTIVSHPGTPPTTVTPIPDSEAPTAVVRTVMDRLSFHQVASADVAAGDAFITSRTYEGDHQPEFKVMSRDNDAITYIFHPLNREDHVAPRDDLISALCHMGYTFWRENDEPTVESTVIIEQPTVEVLQARLDAMTAERDILQTRSNNLQTRVDRLESDVTTICQELLDESHERSWCSEYESFVDRVNPNLNTAWLQSRNHDYTVTVTLEFSGMRQSSDAMRELVSGYVGRVPDCDDYSIDVQEA